MQKDYLGTSKINTIYFGGGTPSVLEEEELKPVMDALNTEFSIENDAEITIEINPDDASAEKLEQWIKQGINRLSIGVQSFSESELQFMNRSHTAEQSLSCLSLAKRVGFDKISIDLIYGGYKTSNDEWQKNIDTFLRQDISHLSAYALTVEDKTKLAHDISKGILAQPDEAKTITQFEILMDAMLNNNYEHYEISNFAKSKCRAKHNSNYWTGKSYLGIGPAAHSYNGKSRQWNVANNALYIAAIQSGNLNFEKETLSANDMYNEHIMTGLRTSSGCVRNFIDKNFEARHLDSFDKALEKHMAESNIKKDDSAYILTRKGKFIADSVMSDFFV